MESKTKHRILGVVVVAGLAVLAYPFIQGSNKAQGEQALVKAPPFPDQAVQVASTEALSSAQPQEVVPPAIAESTPPAPSQQTALDSNSANIAPQDTSKTPEQPQATAPAPVPVESTPAAPAAPEADKVKPSPSAGTIDNGSVEPVKSSTHKKLSKAHAKDQPVILSKLTTASAIKANRHQPLDNNGLLQLKKSAWVIQLGSFKEKSNALRMVNKLRASGYRAFIQHVSGSRGQSTRVFVGPEHQQASARIVASELESNLKLHGIVISYKPFSL